MPKTKHTPGPWRVEQAGATTDLTYRVKDAKDRTVAIVCGKNPALTPRPVHQIPANARLIGATPEMYEALLCQADLDAYDEEGGVAAQNEIVSRWLTRLDELFPLPSGGKHTAGKGAQDEFSHTVFRLLPSVLRHQALTKARGEGRE